MQKSHNYSRRVFHGAESDLLLGITLIVAIRDAWEPEYNVGESLPTSDSRA